MLQGSVRGTKDIFGKEMNRHSTVVKAFESLANLFNYGQIITPTFEFTSVFSRTLGEDSDVVNKEMYTFLDRSEESITLKPEGTASVARAVLSNSMLHDLPLKFFYTAPMFRYERPQKGRKREFFQIGIEYIGEISEWADLEVISLAYNLLQKLKLLAKTTLHINTIGSLETRMKYKKSLVDFLQKYAKELSSESQKRLVQNPLRILDSKDQADKQIVQEAPLIYNFLSQEEQDNYQKIKNLLDINGIKYQEDPKLVRGLDYYNNLVFEFVTDELGAQSTIIAGGRYDNLLVQMGAKEPIPAVGFAGGVERLALLLPNEEGNTPPIYIITPNDLDYASEIATIRKELLNSEIKTEVIYGNSNLNKKLKKANKKNAHFVCIVAEDEKKNGYISFKDMRKGTQDKLTIEQLKKVLTK